MKVKRKNEVFKPVKFEITIESEDELLEMYARINACLADIRSHGYNGHPYEGNDNTGKLHRFLVDECYTQINN